MLYKVTTWAIVHYYWKNSVCFPKKYSGATGFKSWLGFARQRFFEQGFHTNLPMLNSAFDPSNVIKLRTVGARFYLHKCYNIYLSVLFYLLCFFTSDCQTGILKDPSTWSVTDLFMPCALKNSTQPIYNSFCCDKLKVYCLTLSRLYSCW